MFEKLFAGRDFIPPKVLAESGLMSLTKQWELRKNGDLGCFRVGAKILYTRQHLENYFGAVEQTAKNEQIAA